jgi:hypothetical protein
MGMKKDLFEKLIEPLGSFKRKWGGHLAEEAYEDMVFEPTKAHVPCSDCDLMVRDRVIIIERKLDRDDTPYWRTKCHNCKRKWNDLRR